MPIDRPTNIICEICGGPHATPHHPEKNESGETIDVEKESVLRNEYKDLMNVYQRLTRDIKKLERKYPPERRDEASKFEILDIDKERHQTHLQLISIAEQLGKTKDEVIIDIIRWQKSLEEFGLPEFSILNSLDIIDTGPHYRGVQFNVTIYADRPTLYNERQTVLDEPFWEEAEIPENKLDRADYFKSKQFEKENFKPVIDDDEVLIVFSVYTITPKEKTSRALGYLIENKPIDHEERIHRAEVLADRVGGKFFDKIQGSFHETDARVIGVVIPKKDVEKVAEIIRNNPTQFRLGDKFYK